MKKVFACIIVIILALLMLVPFCLSAFAAGTVTVSLTPSKTQINDGEELTISVNLSNLNLNEGLNCFNIEIAFDNGVYDYLGATEKLSKVEPPKLTDNKINISFSDVYNPINSVSKICNLKFKAKAVKNSSFSFSCSDFSDKAGRVSVQNGSITVKTTKSDCDLSSLSISGGQLGPAFNKKIFQYTLYIENDNPNCIVNAVKSDSKAQMNIEGTQNVKDGSIIKITVTAQSGDVQIYQISVKKSVVPTTSGTQTTITESEAASVSGVLDEAAVTSRIQKEKDDYKAIYDNQFTNQKNTYVIIIIFLAAAAIGEFGYIIVFGIYKKRGKKY